MSLWIRQGFDRSNHRGGRSCFRSDDFHLGFCCPPWPLQRSGVSPAASPRRNPHNRYLPPLASQTAQVSLIATPDPLDLGNLSPGEASQENLILRNIGDKPIDVARVKTSCECISIEPKSSLNVVVRYDPGESPDFRGGLRAIVTGESSVEEPLFRATVELSVRERSRREVKP